ncbi:C39 family peptidase [Bacillaceae bacterium W0354]
MGYIILFSMFFTLLLYAYAKKGHAFKRTSLFFAQLFFVCSLSLTIVFISQNKDELTDWFKENLELDQDKHSIVYAEEKGFTEPFQQPSLYQDFILEDEILIDAPHIQQLPELPRGCEVTSLAMLLEYHDVEADKMELAEQVTRDNTPYEVKDGQVHFGNPYNGFVGDMYSFSTPGYGVYHGPITDLAKQYVGNRAIDLTGHSFETIYAFLNKSEPVLIITNATYKPLPESSFETWQTADGPVKITYREHAVLVVGYDEHFIYYNDPLQYKLKKAPKNEFIGAWEQMGKQAVTILKES